MFSLSVVHWYLWPAFAVQHCCRSQSHVYNIPLQRRENIFAQNKFKHWLKYTEKVDKFDRKIKFRRRLGVKSNFSFPNRLGKREREEIFGLRCTTERLKEKDSDGWLARSRFSQLNFEKKSVWIEWMRKSIIMQIIWKRVCDVFLRPI